MQIDMRDVIIRRESSHPLLVFRMTSPADISPPYHDADWQKRLRKSVTAWYRKQGRDLPWRDERDPYRVWIREIMLQQTTVTAVIPYFDRFMQRFPTLKALADADEADVLHAWEGLGYYSRARNLHRAAKQLITDHDGEFPRDAASLQSLPGIGRYTAGAIASFAFQLRAPIVEANTLRLYSRLLGYQHSPKASAGQSLLWDFAERILPHDTPGTFNQALMDLGATVCTAESPNCTNGCPLTAQCLAFARSEQHLIPLSAARPATESVIEAAIVVRDDNRYLLIRRPQGARWAGLWDFPRYSLGADPAPDATLSGRELTKPYRDAERRFAAEWKLPLAFDRPISEIVHHVTRYRIRLLCYLADAECVPAVGFHVEHAWITADEFGKYPMPVSGRKLAKLIASPSSQKPRSGRKKAAKT